jgi:hypothetical protein
MRDFGDFGDFTNFLRLYRLYGLYNQLLHKYLLVRGLEQTTY